MLLRFFTVSVGVVVSYGVFCFAPTFGAPTQTVRFAGTKSVSACGEFRYDQAPEVATGISPFAITVADIDGDGREDLVSGFLGIGGGGVAIARNLGGGRYAPRVTYGVTSGSFSPETVAARDIDADGRPDIFASSAETRIVYFRNNSSPV
ncbi:MAG: VCBS repeat-containing protein [Acidobacteria bacterium]|nr:VCBS repeat-containing protein [Acidobacteriota bacterium]